MEFPNYFSWTSHHNYLRLKRRLSEMDLLDDDDAVGSSLDLLVREVIAPEIFAHMISHDMHIQYDEALEILYEPNAWAYGNLLNEADNVLILLGGTAAIDMAKTYRTRKGKGRR